MLSGSNELAVEALHVHDLDRSLAFYRDELGLEQVGEPTSIADTGVGRLIGRRQAKFSIAVLALPGTSAMLELVEFEDPAGEAVDPEHANPGTTHLAFYVDDMESAWKQLERNGVESVSGPEPIEIPSGPMTGGYAMYLKDPDGIRVELVEGKANLDGDPRDPALSTGSGLVTEFAHFGLHVGDLASSLAFYHGLFGFELVVEWFGKEEFLRRIVGYPQADVNIGILRLPNSPSYLELIEFGNVARKPVDPAAFNPKCGHLTLLVEDIASAIEEIRSEGFDFVSEDFIEISSGPLEGAKAIFCKDPDGVWVQLIESETGFDGAPR